MSKHGEQLYTAADMPVSRRLLLAGMLAATSLHIAGCSSPERRSTPFQSTPDWEQDFSSKPDGPFSFEGWNAAEGSNNGWGNKQRQTYTNSERNIRVMGGRLLIEAHREHDEDKPPYTSARIDTKGKQSFGYGKLEITAQLPKGVGTWPAFWMLSDEQKYIPGEHALSPTETGAWVLNGEIDIMEAVGSRPGIIYPAVHTFDSVTNGQPLKNRPQVSVPDSADSFHKYGVERTPDGMTFTFDGTPYYQLAKRDFTSFGHDNPKAWPFDQRYYLIVNLALGGGWGGEKAAQYPPYGIDDQSAPWQLQVASIKHYPLAVQSN